MEKSVIETLVHQGLSTYQISKALNCGQTNTRYWLTKFGLKTSKAYIGKQAKHTVEKLCIKCALIKPAAEFYKKASGHLTGYCKSCSNTASVDRQRALKLLAVKYKGGACNACGYDRFYGALEFHHINPAVKDFAISQKAGTALTLAMQQELDKCMLLCANCHRELHNKLYLDKSAAPDGFEPPTLRLTNVRY